MFLVELFQTPSITYHFSEAEKQMKECYENYRNGSIEPEQYSDLMGECTKKIEVLNNQLSVLKKAERDKQVMKKSSDIAKSVLSESGISRKVIEELIEKVYAFPNNQIRVNWRIADFFAVEHENQLSGKNLHSIIQTRKKC